MTKTSTLNGDGKHCITLLYDGACHLCSREIAHYRRRNTTGQLAFVDISSPQFDAGAWGADRAAINKHMHVRLGDGSYRVGLWAFIAVWEVLPGYAWLARLAKTPGINAVMRGAYAAFAEVRPWLPKRKNQHENCPIP